MSASRIIIKFVGMMKVLIKLARNEVVATNLFFTRRDDIISKVRACGAIFLQGFPKGRESPSFTLLAEFDSSPTPGTTAAKPFLL
jgi:hypothetical protein